jgi:hypothetical protein
MKIVVKRLENSGDACTGDMYIDGNYFCHTLEDLVRAPGVKVQDKTAIPAGIYRVIVNMSPKFKKLMPRLLDVPMFTGILIHSGNDAIDTRGCILVGSDLCPGAERIRGGSVMFPILMTRLHNALALGETISIQMTDQF